MEGCWELHPSFREAHSYSTNYTEKFLGNFGNSKEVNNCFHRTILLTLHGSSSLHSLGHHSKRLRLQPKRGLINSGVVNKLFYKILSSVSISWEFFSCNYNMPHTMAQLSHPSLALNCSNAPPPTTFHIVLLLFPLQLGLIRLSWQNQTHNASSTSSSFGFLTFFYFLMHPLFLLSWKIFQDPNGFFPIFDYCHPYSQLRS